MSYGKRVHNSPVSHAFTRAVKTGEESLCSPTKDSTTTTTTMRIVLRLVSLYTLTPNYTHRRDQAFASHRATGTHTTGRNLINYLTYNYQQVLSHHILILPLMIVESARFRKLIDLFPPASDSCNVAAIHFYLPRQFLFIPSPIIISRFSLELIFQH